MTTDETVALILDILTQTVAWVLVPLIMLGLVVVARTMVLKADDPDRLTAARAGWWAGLLLFLLYFIYALPDFRPPDLTGQGGLSIHVWGTVLGAVAGFAFLWGLSFLSAARVAGLVVLLLTVAGLASLHTYLFLENRGEWLVGGVLGGALGALLHLVVFPGSLTGTGREKEEEPPGPPRYTPRR